jgi:hypothetical protein
VSYPANNKREKNLSDEDKTKKNKLLLCIQDKWVKKVAYKLFVLQVQVAMTSLVEKSFILPKTKTLLLFVSTTIMNLYK